jgi:hypothetical protein
LDSSAVIADIEEFLVEPFGTVTSSSVRKGPYSVNGKEMINNGLLVKKTFEECVLFSMSILIHAANGCK